jgi:hypothetical protein
MWEKREIWKTRNGFWEFILGPWGWKASTGEQSDISPEVK